jgi:hypothetical protein
VNYNDFVGARANSQTRTCYLNQIAAEHQSRSTPGQFKHVHLVPNITRPKSSDTLKKQPWV